MTGCCGLPVTNRESRRHSRQRLDWPPAGTRSLSSVRLERSVHIREVTGSNPVGTTEPETAPSHRAALSRKALQSAGLPGLVIFGCEAVRGKTAGCCSAFCSALLRVDLAG